MVLPGRRPPNPVLRPVADGEFEMVLAEPIRETVVGLLDELALVIAEPDDPRLRRLTPPAYPDDPEREAAYQILAGDELRTSRLASVATAREAVQADRLTDEEVWAWLRSLNALRLIVGVELGIEDDDDDPLAFIGDGTDDEDTDRRITLARIYDLVTEIQNWAVVALRGDS